MGPACLSIRWQFAMMLGVTVSECVTLVRYESVAFHFTRFRNTRPYVLVE